VSTVDHLTPLDATFLELEEADETAHMHIGGLMVFESRDDGPGPSLDDFESHLGERLVALPRYRQRLSEPHTGGLRWPHWEDAPGFNLHDHLRRAALPAPGGEDELLTWVSDYWAQRLDRRRPLWDMVLVEGLEDGRWALCTKTHHCMVDGVGSVDVAYVLLDPEPQPSGWAARAVVQPSPGNGGGVRSAVGRLAHTLDPRHLPELLERSRAAAAMLVRDELIAAPSSSLNQPIGTRRRIAVVRIPLEDIKAVKRELGGTVNDVVLALVSGGLRRLLLARGEEPPRRGLRAMVPVNIRSAGERLGLGNHITSLFVHLPVAEEHPVARYLATVKEAEALKAGNAALGGKTVVDLTALAPPVVHATLARSLFATRLFNVTVTNVPGPPQPLYALGCRLREVFGLVPLAADHAVGVAVLSYAGEMTFTISADHDSVPDVEVLADGIRESLAELRALAAQPSR